MAQVQEKKHSSARHEETPPPPPVDKTGEAKVLRKKMEEVVDSIDDVLEKNVEVFMKNFVQSNGE